MLQSTIRWSLNNRPVVFALATMCLVLGVYSALHSDLDAFPEFAPPQVIVQTEAIGLSSEETETLITLPLEQSILGLPGLESIRSRSIQGLSAITVVFKDGIDPYLARQLVGQKLGEAQSLLPDAAEIPKLGPMTQTTGRLMVIGFTSKSLNQIELRDHIQWEVRPRLIALGGVAMASIFGGDIRQYQVRVHPDELIARDIGINDVIDGARQSSMLRGGGFVETESQRVVVRTEGQAKDSSDVGETIIAKSTVTPVRLKDVASVVEGAEPKFGATTINGQNGVAVLIYKQFGSDTLTVTRSVEAELDLMKGQLAAKGIYVEANLFRQADFIEKSIGNVMESLWVGAILVALVLGILLLNIRVAVISLLAIPLSLLAAITVLWWMQISLNALTLGGLAIAVGEVVDDAIIDVENIHRRFREKANTGSHFNWMEVALDASLEVRSAVVYATLIVILVFLPILAMGGVQGKLFAPLGYAYILAVVASLIVALTVTPAMSILLLHGQREGRTPFVLAWLQDLYEALLTRILPLSKLVVVFSLLMAIGAFYFVRNAGGEFLPELRESHLVIHKQALAGISLQENIDSGLAVTKYLEQSGEVEGVCHLAGRAELGEDTWGIEYGEIEVPLSEATDVAQFRNELLEELPEKFPGHNFHVFTFLSECIHESISGSIAPVVVKLRGSDLYSLDSGAKQVLEQLRGIRGNDSAFIEPQTGQPQCVIRVNHERAALYGIRPAEIVDAINAAYQGTKVGQIYDRNRVHSIVVIHDERERSQLDGLNRLWLKVPVGRRVDSQGSRDSQSEPGSNQSFDEGRVLLTQVADVFLSDGRYLVTHENGMRSRYVICSVKNRDVSSFVNELEARLDKIKFSEGISVHIAGDHFAKQETQRQLLFASIGALIAIVFIVWMALRSVFATLLVMLNVPFALIGGVVAIFVLDNTLNVGSLVGFVTLFGITMRNGIMMVSHWNTVMQEFPTYSTEQVLLKGARDRIGPILMTAIVTGLGLAPIALFHNEAGREIEGPMAVVILFGLISSTFLNLFALPSAAYMMDIMRRV